MTPVCRTRCWLLVFGMLGAVPDGVVGQGAEQFEYILRAEGGGPDLDLRTVRSGFQLFASADAALSGLRMTGNHGASFTNYADCSNVLYSCQFQRMVRASTGTSVALWFHLGWVAGSPPVNFKRIRAVAPSVANALGGGYTAGFNEELTGGRTRWGPADLTLGRLFSGVASTNDASCRNNTGFGNAVIPAGIPLLPQSVCPDTWGSNGWEGAQRSSPDDWAAWARQRGAAFTFDFWRLPAALHRPGYFSPLMHTYGETTDYYANIRALYGSVVPGGTGAPVLQGYPLGLKIRFDVFAYDQPPVDAVKFVRALVINRSEDVYGTGVDYDSLIFGISAGDLGSSSNGTAHYYLPEVGAVIRVRAGANTATNPCNDSFREPVFACAPTNGWQSGSQAIIVFKSPIGDLRNRLFTRTNLGNPCVQGTDPFCNPAHPQRGDTFTINQGRMCGFGQCNTFVWVGGGTRSGYGFLAGNETLTLNGRDPNAQIAGQMWSTFRSPVWPNRARFSKYRPDPTWDYNKDGIPDTLSLTSCHTQGCAGLASDTTPGGFVNLSSNVGGHHSAGPFSLGAGDTVAFFYAVIGGRDSIHTMSQVAAAIDLYLNFFIQPEPPPPVAVLETETRAATDAFGSTPPRVRLVLSDALERWVDPYLLKLGGDINAAPPGTGYGDLAALNPGLGDTLRARAANNLDLIEIYKSCDGGVTFTISADCRAAPSLDPQQRPLGLGWQAWRTFVYAGPGSLPAVVTDSLVQGGRAYRYVVIAKSRGVTLTVNQVGGGTRQMEYAPALRNGVPSGPSVPNVVTVYVPASRAAGYRAATAVMTARPPMVTVPFALDVSDDAPTGSYTATFGNRILVHRDSFPDVSVHATSVEVQHRVTADDGGLAVPQVVFAQSFVQTGDRPADAVFPVVGAGTASVPMVQPDLSVRVTTTYNALGFVVTSGNAAYFASTALTGAAATPVALLRDPASPGFSVSANNAIAGTFDPASEMQVRGVASLNRLRLAAADTIVPRALVDAFMPQWQEGTALSVKTGFGGGVYEITWTDDAYGRPEGFVLNRGNPSATGAEVAAALAARVAGTTGLTDNATAQLTGIALTDLVAVRVPFTVRNVTFDRPVRLAMARRLSNRILLGTGADTASVSVPTDEWIPGDALVFIEDVEQDSSTSIGVVLAGGTPIRVTPPRVTFSLATIGCHTAVRLSCNPLMAGTAGATGYNGMFAGDRTFLGYRTQFLPGTQYAWDVTGPVTATDVTQVTDSALGLIRVVPNPFVVYSSYQADATDSRILFTNLPPRGTLRIYTVAGQFVQQITWTPGDLDGAGDLFFNLNTLAGNPMATGLYVWVLTTPADQTDPARGTRRAVGKFVIIRGAFQ